MISLTFDKARHNRRGFLRVLYKPPFSVCSGPWTGLATESTEKVVASTRTEHAAFERTYIEETIEGKQIDVECGLCYNHQNLRGSEGARASDATLSFARFLDRD